MTWIERDVHSNGQRLNVIHSPDLQAKPVVVLVHGFTDSARCWQSLMEPLEAEYALIAYDQRGHGSSTRVTSRFSLFDLVDDLLGVLDAMQVQRAALIGHSLGALVVLAAGAAHPRRMTGIIAEDPPLAPVLVQPDFNQWRADHARVLTEPREKLAAQYRNVQYPTWSETDIETRVDARLQADLRLFDLLDWAAPPHWTEWIAPLSAPLLLLGGNPEKGGVLHPQMAEQVLRLCPQATFRRFDELGHHLRCEQPATYLALVRDFLGGLSPA